MRVCRIYSSRIGHVPNWKKRVVFEQRSGHMSNRKTKEQHLRKHTRHVLTKQFKVKKKRTERHNRVRSDTIVETRRLKTGSKDKVAAVVEKRETEVSKVKEKTKQKLVAVTKKGA